MPADLRRGLTIWIEKEKKYKYIISLLPWLPGKLGRTMNLDRRHLMRRRDPKPD